MASAGHAGGPLALTLLTVFSAVMQFTASDFCVSTVSIVCPQGHSRTSKDRADRRERHYCGRHRRY
jgi:hypothetical protein